MGTLMAIKKEANNQSFARIDIGLSSFLEDILSAAYKPCIKACTEATLNSSEVGIGIV